MDAGFDIGDRTLAYRRTGAGSPIVVLNGFAATKDGWDPAFTAALASEHEPVLVDSRGMGESGDDGRPFTVADIEADVAGLIAELELGAPTARFPACGHGFMADHPAQLARLIAAFLCVADPNLANQPKRW